MTKLFSQPIDIETPMNKICNNSIIMTEKFIIKGIKDLYKHINTFNLLRYEKASQKKIKNEEIRITTINNQILELESNKINKLKDNYNALVDDYKRSGNGRNILSIINYKSSFEKKLELLHSHYTQEMNRHLILSDKLERKIDVLEDEMQYFHNNWKNKKYVFEKRIHELNEGLEYNEMRIKTDSEIKIAINEYLSSISNLKEQLKQKYEELNTKKQKETRKQKYEEKKKSKESKKVLKFTLQVTVWTRINKADEEKMKIKANIKRFNNGTLIFKKLFKEKHVTIKAYPSFQKIYDNTYTFHANDEYIGIQADKKYYVDYDKYYNLLQYLESDDKFVKQLNTIHSYIEMIEVTNVNVADIKSNFNPVEAENFKSSTNNYVCFKYIKYDLNKKATTFEEMFNRSENTKETDVDNSCYVNLLVNTYNKAINDRFTMGSRKYESNKKKLLTAQKICEICDITYKESNIGLSIKKSIKFFELYKLGLKAIDNFGNLIYNYEPSSYNKHLYPRTLYILVHNNHVEILNCNEHSFQQVMFEVKKQHVELEASSRFPVFKNGKKDYKTFFINKLDDVVEHVINNEELESEDKCNIKFIYDGSMQEMVFEMLNARYLPEIIYKDNTIKGIYFKINDYQYAVQYSNMAPDTIHTINEEEFNIFNQYNNRFSEWLLNEKFVSRFDEETRSILDTYNVCPLTAQLEYNHDKKLIGIDRRRAYTSNLYELDNIPVFNVFDKFLEYDQHDISDYTIYLAKFQDCIETQIFVGANYAIVYGQHLKKCELSFTIIKYLKPSNLIESNSRGIIDELYSSELDDDHKKNIVNHNIGRSGKTLNIKNIVKIYMNKDEAHYYANLYNATVYPIKSTEIIEDITFTDDIFVEHLFDSNFVSELSFKMMYLVAIEKECKLDENMLPVKHFIYVNQRLKNLQLYRTLIKNDIKPYGIKTDSILVEASQEKKIKNIFANEFEKEIGGLKIEYNKANCDKRIDMIFFELTETNKREVSTYYLKTEENFFHDLEAYNNEIISISNKHNRIMIWSWYPGSGKSYASSLLGKNILYVTPYNQLCQELIVKGFKAITLHNLMALNITGQISKRKKFDVSPYDTIVFEEILLYDPQLLSNIHRFIKAHPEKRIIANGDDAQNLPLNFNFNNIATKNKYLVDCIMNMFDAHIILKMNKRLKNPSDRQKLENLKRGIFDLNLDVIDFFNKYNFKIIENINQLQTTDNVSYFRPRSFKINKFVQDNLVVIPEKFIEFNHEHNNKTYPLKYYEGQHIICRQPFKRKNAELFTNYIYQILSYSLDISDSRIQRVGLKKAFLEAKANMKYIFKIKSIYQDKIMKLSYKQLKNMSLPHCYTCHSTQGLTIPRPYTIFDTNVAYTDRRWIYTAITRATYFENITIFKHSEKECQMLEKCKYKQYFDLKIQNYINQDVLAGRIKQNKEGLIFKGLYIDNYVSYDWIMNQPNFKCYLCGCIFDFDLEDSRVNSNFSIDRQDNRLPHTKDNCKLCCVNCNRAKR